MKDEKHKMIIEVPTATRDALSDAAEKDGRKLKPYVEMVLVKHGERKSKKK